MKQQSGRPFAVFDIDGTLIRWQLYHAITDELARQGYVDPREYRAMQDARMAWKRRSGGSFRDYEVEVIRIYESVLKTLTFEQFELAIDSVFEEYKDQVYTYTRDLIAKLKEKNYLLFAISGSQIEIVSKIAEYYGFDEFNGTIYARGDDGFTGKKIIGSHHKDRTLNSMIKKRNARTAGSIAVGDSFSDVVMLELASQAIALNPEEKLFKRARAKGWKIVIERKNMVYQLEKRNGKYELVKTN